MDKFNLQGKIALVTGSSRGIGFVLARGLGRAGAAVVLNSRNEDALNNAVDMLKNEGINTYGSVFDITKKDQVQVGIKQIENEIGPINILVNNAGIQRRAPLEDFNEEDWEAVIETNLSGVFFTSQQVAKAMIARKEGKIINICSLQSELGRQNITPYAASKGGVRMLTRGMAVEWAKHNIQINGIGPGYFITEMTKPLAEDKEFNAWICARTPANRWGDPEELVGAAIFLASSASDYVSGQIIYVDGGILAAI